MVKSREILLVSLLVAALAVFLALRYRPSVPIEFESRAPVPDLATRAPVPDPFPFLKHMEGFYASIEKAESPHTNFHFRAPFPFEDEVEDEDGTRRGLSFGFYRKTCPRAESIVKSSVEKIYAQHPEIAPAFLRLHFHDCFISGCDASVLLDDSDGNSSHPIERNAGPNQSLRGLNYIDAIKEDLEAACPGTISCADTIAIATRNAFLLDGGPFYPLLTGRRDSLRSFFTLANAELPRPDGNISETLRLFSIRGFTPLETVSLLGGHNIGRISCIFFSSRFSNFMGTARPDPSLASDFLEELRAKCANGSHVSLGQKMDTHYFRELVNGRGVLFADQQLMADNTTAEIVRMFAASHPSVFRRQFAGAMLRMSMLNVLTGPEGEVRTHCSLPLRSTKRT